MSAPSGTSREVYPLPSKPGASSSCWRAVSMRRPSMSCLRDDMLDCPPPGLCSGDVDRNPHVAELVVHLGLGRDEVLGRGIASPGVLDGGEHDGGPVGVVRDLIADEV